VRGAGRFGRGSRPERRVRDTDGTSLGAEVLTDRQKSRDPRAASAQFCPHRADTE
jgi:hypothetical protein